MTKTGIPFINYQRKLTISTASGVNMAKKSGRKARKKRELKQADNNVSMQRSRIILMAITSILLIGYLTWRLGPTIGYVKAALIGFGLASVWMLFIMSSTILDWVRRR